jgi:hypothetical protein
MGRAVIYTGRIGIVADSRKPLTVARIWQTDAISSAAGAA